MDVSVPLLVMLVCFVCPLVTSLCFALLCFALLCPALRCCGSVWCLSGPQGRDDGREEEAAEDGPRDPEGSPSLHRQVQVTRRRYCTLVVVPVVQVNLIYKLRVKQRE